MAAFDHAVTLGVDAIECDVHLSRDGEAVVIHDATLDRTTDAHRPRRGLHGATSSRASTPAHAVRRGRRVSVSRPRHRRAAAGRPAVGAIRRMPVIVEIKGDDRTRRRARRSTSCAQAGAAARVIIGGFSQRRARRRAPQRAGAPDRRVARRGPAPRCADRRSVSRRAGGYPAVSGALPPARPPGDSGAASSAPPGAPACRCRPGSSTIRTRCAG